LGGIEGDHHQESDVASSGQIKWDQTERNFWEMNPVNQVGVLSFRGGKLT